MIEPTRFDTWATEGIYEALETAIATSAMLISEYRTGDADKRNQVLEFLDTELQVATMARTALVGRIAKGAKVR